MTLEQTYTPEEAANYLKVVTAHWLKRKAGAGAIPHTRLGRKVVFTEAHLQAILAMFASGSVVTATRPQSKPTRKAQAPSPAPAAHGQVRELVARPERSRSYRRTA